jgi:hypothetical protein
MTKKKWEMENEIESEMETKYKKKDDMIEKI